jgi:hypothetical protein
MDLTEVTIIALKKKPKAAKYRNQRAISLVAYTANTVARIS